MKYIIEIYTPNSASDVLANFEADAPFIAIGKGDILNPAFFPSYDKNPEKVLRVIGIEHIIWQHEGQEAPTQKILLFTREENNSSDARIYS